MLINELKNVEICNDKRTTSHRKKTWILTKMPFNKILTDVKWVLKLNLSPNGSIVNRKARLVGKVFLQKQGLGYSKLFAPVARNEIKD